MKNHATKFVFYHQLQVWIKTNNNNSSKLFKITIGGKHGAENCELVGLYILNGIKSKLNGIKVGIYRNYGLIAIDKNTSGPDITKIKKKIHEYVLDMTLNCIMVYDSITERFFCTLGP